MKLNRKYLVAVALLAVLVIMFGLAGTVAPVTKPVSPEQSSSSDSFTRFASTEATYDSGWVDITHKHGQYFALTHGLNTTENVIVDVSGKQSLDPEGGVVAWTRRYGKTGFDSAYSLVQTGDGGYVLAGYTSSGDGDLWLVKTDSYGNVQWNKTYGGANYDYALSVVQTGDGGYALAGRTSSFGAGKDDLWVVKTDSAGNMEWNKTFGGANSDIAYSLVQTGDGGYALAGYNCSCNHGCDCSDWLVKTDVETGLAWTCLTPHNIILYRGRTDSYWNYVRVRLWLIKEPTWQFGDITGPEGIPDGKVDIYDLALVGKNYGKALSLLSLTGIIAIAGIQTYKTRKRPE